MKTLRKKSREKPDYFTGEDEHLLTRIQNAVGDQATEAFEKKINPATGIDIWYRRNLAKAAAVFIILLSVYIGVQLLSGPHNNKLYARYYKHFPVEETSGVVRGELEIREEGILFYSAKKYDQAIPRLQEVVRTDPDDAEARFLLAISLIETGQTDESSSLLNDIITAPENYYTDDALWYHALLLLNNTDLKASKELLCKIGPSSSYYSLAQELLKKMGDQ